MMRIATYTILPLLEAASTGQTDLCRYILEQGYVQGVDILDSDGLTSLYWAYYNSHWTTTVPFLLEQGADIDFRFPYPPSLIGDIPVEARAFSSTILYETCEFGRYEDAVKLVRLGADVNKGMFGDEHLIRGPLHATSSDAKQYSGEPPQHPPLKLSQPRVLAEYNEDRRITLMQTMLQAGAEIDINTSEEEDTPLHLAARHKLPSALETLLVAGANVQARSWFGRTPLMESCIPTCACLGARPNGGIHPTGPLALIRQLLDHGSSLNATDGSGNTVLHLLCKFSRKWADHDSQSIIRLLLDRGAKENVKNRAGETPFRMAFDRNLKLCGIFVRRRRTVQPFRSEELHIMLESNIRTRPKCQEAFNLLYDLDISGALWTTSKPLMYVVDHFFLLTVTGTVPNLLKGTLGPSGASLSIPRHTQTTS